MTPRRFYIRVYWWLRPLLWLFGATAGNSYVELTRHQIRTKFGWFTNHVYRLDEIASLGHSHWRWWEGIGIDRLSVNHRVGQIGSLKGIVEVRLKERRRLWWLWRCDSVVISLEEPEAFVIAVNRALGVGANPD